MTSPQARLHEEVLGLSGKLWQHYLRSLSQVPAAHEQNQPPLSPASEQAQNSKPWSLFALRPLVLARLSQVATTHTYHNHELGGPTRGHFLPELVSLLSDPTLLDDKIAP